MGKQFKYALGVGNVALFRDAEALLGSTRCLLEQQGSGEQQPARQTPTLCTPHPPPPTRCSLRNRRGTLRTSWWLDS